MWSTARGARDRTRAATSARGWMVPTSLFTSITDTTAVRSSNAASSRSRSMTPPGPTPIVATRNPSASSRCAAASTPLCSIAEVTTPSRPPAARAARAAPFTARLSASVPPPVNTTSPGAQPRIAAIDSRASSSAVLAAARPRDRPRGSPGGPRGRAASPRRLRAASACSPRGRGTPLESTRPSVRILGILASLEHQF